MDHKMSWAQATDSRPYVYLVKCECGWSEMTFADSPESSIKSIYKKHLLPLNEERNEA